MGAFWKIGEVGERGSKRGWKLILQLSCRSSHLIRLASLGVLGFGSPGAMKEGNARDVRGTSFSCTCWISLGGVEDVLGTGQT